jgi:translation initiation factor 2A
MFKGGKPAARYIPGAGIPGAPPKQPADGKKKKNKKKTNGGDQVLVEEMGKATIELAPVVEVPATDDAAAKKVRNLEKKVSTCFLLSNCEQMLMIAQKH